MLLSPTHLLHIMFTLKPDKPRVITAVAPPLQLAQRKRPSLSLNLIFNTTKRVTKKDKEINHEGKQIKRRRPYHAQPQVVGLVFDRPFRFRSLETINRVPFCRHVYTTPKSFLELLKLYNVLLSSKRENQDNAIERLTTGLQKLRETKDAVTSLEEDLKVRFSVKTPRL